ncbi:hypothetical protein Syun_028562 [Stephania yunnanensis]|uniref:protoporphyrinogen oxidase n=1 Tax=Stephania yunnanensis TaxID=152371 RepID=A0AAP0EBQ6_9MAGN
MAVIPMANSRPLVARHAFPHTNSHPHWVALAYPSSRSTRFRCSIAKETPYSKSKVEEGDPNLELDCVVVGAGISGLCVAQALSSHKHYSPNMNMNVIVTEASDRVGGNITTVEKEGYLWEEGPNSFQPSDSVLSAVKDSGLLDDLVLGDPTAPRFVFWDGKLRPLPSKPFDLPFFDLMTFSGKLRAGFGAFGFRPPPPPDHEESVEEFVRRNLGDQVFDRLIEPFCSGVYAGDPAKLSIKAAFGKVWKLEQDGGSLVGGAFKAIQGRNKNPKPLRDPQLPKPKGQTVGSFSKGLRMLPDAISRRLGSKVRLSWKLSSIEKLSKGGYNLTYETPEGLISVQTKVVVMTIPSHVASNLLRPLSNAAADALSKFYYPPVAVVSISYPKEAIREDCLIAGELKGFGQLHPRSQGVETLGTIYSSSLFPNRAPPGRVLLLNFIGGATNVGILNKTDGELVEAVDRDLRKMLIKRNAKDPMALGVRVWPQAIPQFLVGHLDLVDAAQSGLRDKGLGGVFLRGNYVSGVALGRCVEGAYETAAEVYNYLSVYKPPAPMDPSSTASSQGGGDPSDHQVCVFIRKQPKNRNNLRRRPNDEDDEVEEEEETWKKPKRAPKPPPVNDRKLVFSTSTSTSTERSVSDDPPQPIFQFESSKDVQVHHDSRATATLETETDFSRDARAIRERVLKQAQEALTASASASASASQTQQQQQLYKGIHGYTDYKAGFEENILSPVRRLVVLMALSGPLLILGFLLGDYKSGWQLDREWEEREKERKKRNLALAPDVDDDDDNNNNQDAQRNDDDDDEDDSLPFACFICRQPFVDPVVTKCKHYFCEHCALKHHSKNKKCFVCNQPTLGIFNTAHEIKKRIADRN